MLFSNRVFAKTDEPRIRLHRGYWKIENQLGSSYTMSPSLPETFNTRGPLLTKRLYSKQLSGKGT